MIKKMLTGTVAALALSATAASAATLSFVGTGQTHVVTNNDVSATFNTELDMITGDQKTTENGLFLSLASGAARITYTYLGFEAGNTNFASSSDAAFFNNRGGAPSSVGEQFTTVQQTSGLLDFAFGTSAPWRAIALFTNNAMAYSNSLNDAMAIAYSQIDDDSFYVLFDDIATGDRDFDDMVMRIDVATVPLPAGGLLLLSALAGAAAMRRRKKAA